MSEIKNPIPEATRSRLYIIGIVIAAILTPATVALQTLGLQDWIPLATALSAAVGIIVGSLAKSYLSSDDTPAKEEDSTPEAEVEVTAESYKQRMLGLTSQIQNSKQLTPEDGSNAVIELLQEANNKSPRHSA